MKKILLQLLILSLVFPLLGQGPTNADRYNMWVQLTGTKYTPDGQNGTNYVTFTMDAATDTDNNATWLHNTTTGGGYSHTIYWNYDTPETRTDTKYYRTLHSVTNVASHHYDVSFMAFQNNCGDRKVYDECCGVLCLGGSDEGRYNYRYFWNTKYQNEIGLLYTRWIGGSTKAQIRLRHGWRYYRGEGQDLPLAFGTITPGSNRYHLNYNRAAASGASSNLGYKNSWSSAADPAFDDARDVTYSFSLDQLSTVTVSTYYTTTNFDSKVHIVKDLPGSAWEIVASNDEYFSGTDKARLTRTLDAGNYFVVVEGNDGATGKFYLNISASSASMVAGSIDHPTPWVNTGCEITTPIQSATDATASFGTITYDWHVTDDNGRDTMIINAGPTLEGDELGPIHHATSVQRIAQNEGISRQASETIEIEPFGFGVPGNDGIIKGQVTGRDGASGVAGIIVYAVSEANVHGNCKVYSDTTDFNGFYEIANVYYGDHGSTPDLPPSSYKVYPQFEDHIFEADTLIVDGLQATSRIKNNVNFRDITTFFIRGRVTQTDDRSTSATACGVPGARMFLKEVDTNKGELSIWQTDAEGYYSIAVQNQGRHTVRVEYLNHEFAPAISDTLNVIANVADVDFADTSRHTISGSVLACGEFIFGSVVLSIQDTLSCFQFRDTTDASGNFSIELPAGAYNIDVTNHPIIDAVDGYRIEDVMAFFNKPRFVDISEESKTLEMVYRQKPIIEIRGVPINSCGDMVMEQLQEYEVLIDITETNTDGCPLDTGSVVIKDQISGDVQVTLPISNGLVRYPLRAGDPNISGDFKKLISITARHLEDTTFETTLRDYRIVVEGAKQREGTFTTVSPEVPFFILRDPPGDGSYAYLEENTSSEVALGFSYQKGGSVNVWQKARLGTTFEAGVLGFSTETDVWGEVGSSTTVSASNTKTIEAKVSFQNGARYETSSAADPEVMGAGGDLYVGAALTLKYAKADIITYDDAVCGPVKTVDLIMGDVRTQTKYVYTDFSIRNSIIPSLESLRDLEDDPVEKDYYQDQIDVWTQTLQLNEEQKENATANTAFPINGDPGESSISWSGGTSQEYTTTKSVSGSLSLEFNLEIDRELSAELGMNVGGSGRSGGGFIRTRMEFGASISGSALSSRTTGFVLSDDDNLDRFETTVLNDPVYNTPVFRNDVAVTSCPYEPGTSPIDGPVLEALNPVVTNVAPDGNAGFRFRIANESQDEKTRSYYLDVVDDSNPNGANINASLPILFSDIPYGASRERFISVNRDGADPSVFSYEGLEFILYPAECAANGDFATSTARVSAYFNSTCSSVAMAEPQQGWVSNLSDNDIQRIWIKDYDKTQLDLITVQYTEAGRDDWYTAVGPLSPDDLNDNGTNGTYVDWEVDNISDGDYDIRIKLVCGSGTTYTGRVRGAIDRAEPMVFGIPQPADDVYESSANDDISTRYNEEIDCANSTALLVDLETSDSLAVTLSCSGDAAELVPSDLLDLRAPSAYRIVINDVADMHGNVRANTSWVFIVGDYVYDPDCSPVMISNNNDNQDAISQSVYRSLQISSDGTVIGGSTIKYEAEQSIDLEEGFSVENGGVLEASIKNCEDN